MTKRNLTINPQIEQGFQKYSKAVEKVINEDANRQKLIDIANQHIAELVNHVRTYIRKYKERKSIIKQITHSF